MNFILWISSVMIALSMTLAEEKPCKTWLNDNQFTDDDEDANYRRAADLLYKVVVKNVYNHDTRTYSTLTETKMRDLSATNIFVIGYANTIYYSQSPHLESSPRGKKKESTSELSPRGKKIDYSQEVSPRGKKKDSSQESSPRGKKKVSTLELSPSGKKIVSTSELSPKGKSIDFNPISSPTEIQREPLFPDNYCKFLNQDVDINWKNMTPRSTLKTCPEWIELSGYSDDIMKNLEVARNQLFYSISFYFAKCGQKYTNYIHTTRVENILNPNVFCEDVLLVYDARLHFRDCGT